MKRKLVILFLIGVLAIFVGCAKNNEKAPGGWGSDSDCEVSSQKTDEEKEKSKTEIGVKNEDAIEAEEPTVKENSDPNTCLLYTSRCV